MSWVTRILSTSLNNSVEDIMAAASLMKECHPGAPSIVLVVHSFGGGKEIMANWKRFEAPGGYKYPWSPRSQLNPPDEVRVAFGQPEPREETITGSLSDYKTAGEGIQTGFSAFWRFGTANDVLKSLVGIKGQSTQSRKVLHISGNDDHLVMASMVEGNVKPYQAAVEELPGNGETGDNRGIIITISIPRSAHHLIMDIVWEGCALRIVGWMEG